MKNRRGQIGEGDGVKRTVRGGGGGGGEQNTKYGMSLAVWSMECLVVISFSTLAVLASISSIPLQIRDNKKPKRRNSIFS